MRHKLSTRTACANDYHVLVIEIDTVVPPSGMKCLALERVCTFDFWKRFWFDLSNNQLFMGSSTIHP